MMTMIKGTARVLSQKMIADGIYDLVLSFPEAARLAVPGQFVDLYCRSAARLLPRPISICEADAREGSLRLVYRTAGAGTREFSQLKAGDSLEAVGPLGNGFISPEDAPARNTEKVLLIGGGIGIPPLLELARRLPGEKIAVLGYKDVLFLKDDFDRLAGRADPALGSLRVAVATEDGHHGCKGTVLDLIREQKLEGEIIYACGPMPMLKAVSAYALDRGIKARISLEERMACGIGACLGCITKVKHKDHHTNVYNRRVCKDGPVFDAGEVDFS